VGPNVESVALNPMTMGEKARRLGGLSPAEESWRWVLGRGRRESRAGKIQRPVTGRRRDGHRTMGGLVVSQRTDHHHVGSRRFSHGADVAASSLAGPRRPAYSVPTTKRCRCRSFPPAFSVDESGFSASNTSFTRGVPCTSTTAGPAMHRGGCRTIRGRRCSPLIRQIRSND
jgi:hypothetical protein